MRALALALAAVFALTPASDAAKRKKRAKLVLVKKAGRAHVPAWMVRPVVPATVAPPAAAEPAPDAAPEPAPGEPAPAPEPAPQPPKKQHRSGVELDEFTLRVTRNPLDAGAIELVATNFGEDDHDLALSRDGELVAKTEVIPPQESASLSAELGPGTYKVFCSLLDHDEAGMNAGLVVR